MQQEFHGTAWAQAPFKLLYDDWNTLNANVWLPSLSELVGTTGSQDSGTGCYFPAMQGLNLSGNYWTDPQGGAQFAWFKQFNASGGGQKVWATCNQQATWTRSPVFAYADRANEWNNPGGILHTDITVSRAVHPAV